ncbi:MAG TPA: class I SAM-dependent methyltransferase [Tepidisphaeraceae bacterium]|nr:class I SAM-dependent methyltransferase [Tepidisphaeraceae bacterium]
MKSTPKQIEQRFDREVERFSNLETGQSATIDAPLVLDLISRAAAATCPQARSLLDVGCGAGNYTLKLLEKLPNLDVTLIDLSRPMLERAQARITPATGGDVQAVQGDIREMEFPDGSVDVIVAAAVLHHLRTDAEWQAVFRNFHRWLRPGGSVWISDLVEHTFQGVQQMMWGRYGDYLANLKDAAYRDAVFAYLAQEDTPRSLMFQIDMLRRSGFDRIEILHKNSVFAAFGAVKD